MKKFKKVLLVDGDSVSTYLNTSLMRKAEFTDDIITASNGLEACDMLVNLSREVPHDCPDLIFVDTHMAVMDGFEFLETYTQLGLSCSPKVIMLSSSGDERERKRTEKFQSVDFLVKPLTREILNSIQSKNIN